MSLVDLAASLLSTARQDLWLCVLAIDPLMLDWALEGDIRALLYLAANEPFIGTVSPRTIDWESLYLSELAIRSRPVAEWQNEWRVCHIDAPSSRP